MVEIIENVLTVIILVVLIIAVVRRNSVKKEINTYDEDVLEKARAYREDGEADKYRQQIEDAALKELLNDGYSDDLN